VFKDGHAAKKVGENLRFGVVKVTPDFAIVASSQVAPKFLTLLYVPRFLEAANLREKR
jgi:hypothetical protein